MKKTKLNHIEKIESESCDTSQKSFDIIYLRIGPVIVITEDRIGIYQSEESFNSKSGKPMIIELQNEDDINMNLN